MSGKMLTTYSMWRLFRNCRKACQWRYIEELVPLSRDDSLTFGSLIHECLELWHGRRDLDLVLEHIDRACAGRAADERIRRQWHLARAMMTGYARRYPTEDFEVVHLEKRFEGPLVNPQTLAVSRSFSLAGKIDGIVRMGGGYFLLEHKTAAQLDGSYLERLWTDFQIATYTHYAELALGIKITGILYNMLVKARQQQGQGETEEAFAERKAELEAKSKTGKPSAAKRRLPENDEDFQARLLERYEDPQLFHREMLYVGREQIDTLRSELWELSKSFLEARRRNVFYQNTSFCFQYGRPCPYFALCRSGGSPNVIENFYRHEPPHTELAEEPEAEPSVF
jgi:hypothetical protein